MTTTRSGWVRLAASPDLHEAMSAPGRSGAIGWEYQDSSESLDPAGTPVMPPKKDQDPDRRPALENGWVRLATLAGLIVVSAIVGYTVARGSKPSPSKTARAPAARLPARSNRFEPTSPTPGPAPLGAPDGMVWVPGGEFSMGCDDPRTLPHGGREAMNDARPIHRVRVSGFWVDATEVTNDEYARFVAATGYKTVAEQTPTIDEIPGARPEDLVAGSVVFTPPATDVPLDDHYRWWSYVKGADWRHPEGPASNLTGRGAYPVVQVAYEDAEAYASWLGKRLPTEAEWEFAARGGRAGEPYTWGDQLQPDEKWMANIWQGRFPTRDDGLDGFVGIAPVKSYPANGYGLFDASGNVWEWCSDWYRADAYAQIAARGEVADNPGGPPTSHDPAEPGQKKRVHRGGSFLCAEQYCVRYMIGTRGKGEVRTASNHLGFRCVRPGRTEGGIR